jgi:rhamnose utilization protein RhaD (predicted bifunctional aldolase and dehydrogenase)
MDDFVLLCRRLGQLEELAQAGGGNISVKLSDTLSVIKSSGVSLSDVTRDKGYTLYDHASLAANLDVPLSSVVITGPAPSLETYFHCFLKRITVHLHPTAMLPFLCKKDVPHAVPYRKPGLELAKEIRTSWSGGSVLLLQNHGLIVTGDTVDEVLDLCARTYDLYRTDKYVPLKQFWAMQDEFPDSYVYTVCPAETAAYMPILRKRNVRNLTPDIALFLHNAVHIDGPYLFIVGPSKAKCLSILEVLRSYCEVVEECETALAEMDVADILYWPAEVRRKTMQ